MSDEAFSDNELPEYCLAHCETERALFHKTHIVRLLRMADEKTLAEEVERDPREWYSLGPAAIRPIAEKAITIRDVTNALSPADPS